jgi:hypothetical protein
MRSSHVSETTLRDGHHAPLGNRSSRPALSPGDSTPDRGYPIVTSRDPAAMRRTDASCALSADVSTFGIPRT